MEAMKSRFQMQNEVALRQITDGDHAFVIDAWLNTFKIGPLASRMRWPAYRANQKQVILGILSAPGTSGLVAYPSGDDPEIILAFFVFERSPEFGDSAHYMYVQHHLRRMGIGAMMFKESGLSPSGLTFTQWTPDMELVFNAHPEMHYNPFIAFNHGGKYGN